MEDPVLITSVNLSMPVLPSGHNGWYGVFLTFDIKPFQVWALKHRLLQLQLKTILTYLLHQVLLCAQRPNAGAQQEMRLEL
jgi:hypothetical protein